MKFLPVLLLSSVSPCSRAQKVSDEQVSLSPDDSCSNSVLKLFSSGSQSEFETSYAMSMCTNIQNSVSCCNEATDTGFQVSESDMKSNMSKINNCEALSPSLGFSALKSIEEGLAGDTTVMDTWLVEAYETQKADWNEIKDSVNSIVDLFSSDDFSTCAEAFSSYYVHIACESCNLDFIDKRLNGQPQRNSIYLKTADVDDCVNNGVWVQCAPFADQLFAAHAALIDLSCQNTAKWSEFENKYKKDLQADVASYLTEKLIAPEDLANIDVEVPTSPDGQLMGVPDESLGSQDQTEDIENEEEEVDGYKGRVNNPLFDDKVINGDENSDEDYQQNSSSNSKNNTLTSTTKKNILSSSKDSSASANSTSSSSNKDNEVDVSNEDTEDNDNKSNEDEEDNDNGTKTSNLNDALNDEGVDADNELKSDDNDDVQSKDDSVDSDILKGNSTDSTTNEEDISMATNGENVSNEDLLDETDDQNENEETLQENQEEEAENANAAAKSVLDEEKERIMNEVDEEANSKVVLADGSIVDKDDLEDNEGGDSDEDLLSAVNSTSVDLLNVSNSTTDSIENQLVDLNNNSTSAESDNWFTKLVAKVNDTLLTNTTSDSDENYSNTTDIVQKVSDSVNDLLFSNSTTSSDSLEATNITNATNTVDDSLWDGLKETLNSVMFNNSTSEEEDEVDSNSDNSTSSSGIADYLNDLLFKEANNTSSADSNATVTVIDNGNNTLTTMSTTTEVQEKNILQKATDNLSSLLLSEDEDDSIQSQVVVNTTTITLTNKPADYDENQSSNSTNSSNDTSTNSIPEDETESDSAMLQVLGVKKLRNKQKNLIKASKQKNLISSKESSHPSKNSQTNSFSDAAMKIKNFNSFIHLMKTKANKNSSISNGDSLDPILFKSMREYCSSAQLDDSIPFGKVRAPSESVKQSLFCRSYIQDFASQISPFLTGMKEIQTQINNFILLVEKASLTPDKISILSSKFKDIASASHMTISSLVNQSLEN